ncbi:coproporphyrinogen-III oxidase family protein [Bartonella sp. AP285QHHD]|uniref:coproporphyrinogen-III oxidase family protein n=1 Tax=Bartonella sp. AP285QHHD TaxID=3243483 RepID=UPI0035CFD3E1
MQLVDHPFVKFDQLKLIYNFTYPLFRTISNEFYDYLDFNKLAHSKQIPQAHTISLYLHIPFCETICSFCPFQKGAYKHVKQIESYMSALTTEIRNKGNFIRSLRGPIRSIYIGGGTPSLLSADNIRHIGKVLHAEFELSSLTELTLESEPKSVTRDKLYAAREIGVNRISFGLQSFIERFRSLFNLTSTREQINNTVAWSQEIIGHVGLDLLYGMHSQQAEELLYDLKQASELHPETINLYAINNLAITSQLHKSYAQKGLKPSSLQHRQMLRLFSDIVMRSCGYAPCNGHSYIKIANNTPLTLAKTSSANYFRYHKYLHGYHDDYVVGFGASAMSILGSLVTRANPSRSGYITDIQLKGKSKVYYNWVSAEQQASKALCMRLPYNGYAKKERIDWTALPSFVYNNLQQLIGAGLIAESDNNLQLTQRGWQWYSNLMYFLLPQADRNILDGYVANMLNTTAVLDGTVETCVAS